MSDPNLQFIPARTEIGKKIRRCFVADDGEQWASVDYNQQEVRLLVHYACLQATTELRRRGQSSLAASAYEARDRYVADPNLNYHKFVAEITGLVYKAAKILNFAIIYGRGIKETAEELGMTFDETKALFVRHAEKMPFARVMSYRCQDVVKERGYVRSMTGRRMRFPHWEPADWERRTGTMLPREEAEKMWPGVELSRARLHKSLNSLIQPAAADQMKLGMLAVLESGLAPHVRVQVHDELDASVPDSRVADQIAECMRDAVKLEVPVIVDVDLGANWGECT